MTPSPIETDERLLQKVTDALRAGPGTLQWEQVMRELSTGAGAVSRGRRLADPEGIRAETELLMHVRERLAMGRSWREVRAGDGFTRRLMERLDQQPQSAGSTVTLWVFGLAMLAVVGVLLWGVASWYRDRPNGAAPSEVPGWRAGDVVVAYGSPWVVWEFGKPWPDRSALVGALGTVADGEGWRAEVGSLPASDGAAGVPAGHAALLTMPLPMGRGVCVVEAEFELPADIDQELTTHLFIATSTDADERLATLPAGGEWVWQLQNSGLSVVLGDGSVVMLAGNGSVGRGGPAGPRRMTVQVQLSDSGRQAAVSVDGEPAISGPTRLTVPQGGDLFLGVRFVARGDVRGPVVTAKAVRVYPGR